MVDIEKIREEISVKGEYNIETDAMRSFAVMLQEITETLRHDPDKERIAGKLAEAMISVEALREVYGITEDEFDAEIYKKQHME